MNWLIGFLAFYFGASIGSFLNVVILRLPKDESLGGRSYCPKCRNQLSFLNLFPLFSYIFLKGKCGFCSERISIRYFLIEMITGTLFLLRFFYSEPNDIVSGILLLRDWIFISSLVVIFVVDLEHFLILDKILLGFGIPILVMNVILDLFSDKFFSLRASLFFPGLIVGIVFAFIFYVLWFVSKGRWIGFGDVKLMILLGIALGWPSAFIAWILSFFIGTAFSLPLLLMKKKSLSSKLPLGCFLSISSLLALFWGNIWFKWYLAVLGY